MKSIYVTFVFSLFFFVLPLYGNALKNEQSPYLLQHADNPVNWMPWSKKAFVLAKQQNKPLFISIGYSTCHWCHVMEKESFEDKKIANLLNRYFISIKVDREELPQIDALYQNIYKKYYGNFGGWPLNIFVTPEKKVFFITNYIPPEKRFNKEGFLSLLPTLVQIYNDKKMLNKKINLYKKTEEKSIKHVTNTELSLKSLSSSIKQLYQKEYSGFGKSREFPEASKLSLMLDIAEFTADKELQADCFSMLDVMALHGLYDHINGGFFRYSIDTNWEIPHFEKMLYTQAELISLYARAYSLKKKELYKSIVQESISMIMQRFEKDGVFWSESDADTQGEEGAFFTFTQKEIKRALKNNPYAKQIEDALEFSLEGNFKNRVHINFYTKRRPKGFKEFQKALQKIVSKREYPFIDKKINTAWNAMMVEALYKASIIDISYAQEAKRSLAKLTDIMFYRGVLHHQALLGKKAKQTVLLEDYAFFIAALIAAYEVDYEEEHLDFAEYLLMQAKERFFKDGVWYLSDDGMKIKADLNDKYYTSAAGKMVQNILKLAALKASFKYENFAKMTLDSFMLRLIEKKADAPALSRAFLMYKEGIIVLKSKKENLQKNRQQLTKITYPYLLTKAKPFDDYLACTLRQCFAKEKTLNKLIKSIKKLKK